MGDGIDLNSLSNEELMAIADGGGTAPAVDLNSLSNEELIRIAGGSPKPEPLTAGQTFAGGMSDILGKLTFGAGDEIIAGGTAALDALTGEAPLGEAYDQRLAQVRDLTSRYGAEHPYSAFINNAAGFVAPVPGVFSKGKGVANAAKNVAKGAGIGAGYGAAGGFLGAEGGIENRAESAAKGFGIGIAAGGATTAAGELIQGAASKLPEWSAAYNRKSLGARQSDYASTANSIEELAAMGSPDQVASRTKLALDELLSTSSLGESRDAATLATASATQQKALVQAVGQEIANYDRALVAGQLPPVKPTWNNTLNWLASGEAGEKTESFLSRLDDLDQLIKQNGQGKLSYLQAQKIAKGKQWDVADTSVNEFNRMLYADMQQTIEAAAPSVAQMNDLLGKHILAYKVIKRGLAAEENATPMQQLSKLAWGGAGVGVPAYVASALGTGPVGVAVGAGLGLAGRALTTRSGAKVASDVLGSVGKSAGAVEPFTTELARAGIPVTSGESGASLSRNEDRRAAEPFLDGKEQAIPKQGKTKESVTGQEETKPDPKLKNSSTSQKDASNPVANQQLSESDIGFLGLLNSLFGAQPAYADENTGGNMGSDVLPAALVNAVIGQESGGNAKAKSPVGAQGLMQIMPATYREWAPKVGLDANSDPYDPTNNKKVGAAYLAFLMNRYGDPELALAAYNYGLGRIDNLIEKHGASLEAIYAHLPAETQKYVPGVLSRIKKSDLEVA